MTLRSLRRSPSRLCAFPNPKNLVPVHVPRSYRTHEARGQGASAHSTFASSVIKKRGAKAGCPAKYRRTPSPAPAHSPQAARNALINSFFVTLDRWPNFQSERGVGPRRQPVELPGAKSAMPQQKGFSTTNNGLKHAQKSGPAKLQPSACRAKAHSPAGTLAGHSDDSKCYSTATSPRG